MQHLLRGVGQIGALVLISVVRVRNQGVDAVVAAAERDEDEDAAAVDRRMVVGRPLQLQPAAAPDNRPAMPMLAIRNERRRSSGIWRLVREVGFRGC
jgi:hypothetical protein